MSRASQGDDQAETWGKKVLGHYYENLVYSKLEETLAKEDGTLFQGFRSGDYLSLITDGEPVITLSDISIRWVNLAAMKGVDIQSVRNSKQCAGLVK